jgi:hypothetical protein
MLGYKPIKIIPNNKGKKIWNSHVTYW